MGNGFLGHMQCYHCCSGVPLRFRGRQCLPMLFRAPTQTNIRSMLLHSGCSLQDKLPRQIPKKCHCFLFCLSCPMRTPNVNFRTCLIPPPNPTFLLFQEFLLLFMLCTCLLGLHCFFAVAFGLLFFFKISFGFSIFSAACFSCCAACCFFSSSLSYATCLCRRTRSPKVKYISGALAWVSESTLIRVTRLASSKEEVLGLSGINLFPSIYDTIFLAMQFCSS